MILEGAIDRRGPLVQVTWRGPDGTEAQGVGVLDTGGQFTIVDAGLVSKLRLRVLGDRLSKTACGTCTMKRVRAQIRIGNTEWREGDFESTPLPTGTPPIVAVIGMDFLGQGRFTTDGPKRRWRFVIGDDR